jgi:hypothetical protein
VSHEVSGSRTHQEMIDLQRRRNGFQRTDDARDR